MNIQVFYSWLKSFLASVLTAFVAIVASTKEIPTSADAWISILVAGILSVGPVIINWLNPNYTMYGRGSE